MEKALDTIANRIRKALSIRNMKQQELVDKTGIPKSSISQYLSEYAEPKTDRVYAMAKVLDVDPVWLMGFDVPMEKHRIDQTYNDENGELLIEALHDPEAMSLLDIYLSLDESEREAIRTILNGMKKADKPKGWKLLGHRKKSPEPTVFDFREPHDEHPEQ